jgi:hypothetical protein
MKEQSRYTAVSGHSTVVIHSVHCIFQRKNEATRINAGVILENDIAY